jgi:hypothetical protein
LHGVPIQFPVGSALGPRNQYMTRTNMQFGALSDSLFPV